MQRINNFGQRKEKEVQNERKIIMLNKIQMHLILKNNFILFGKIGAQISFDINNRSTPDYFLRNTEVNILGNEEQIKMFEEIINITN